MAVESAHKASEVALPCASRKRTVFDCRLEVTSHVISITNVVSEVLDKTVDNSERVFRPLQCQKNKANEWRLDLQFSTLYHVHNHEHKPVATQAQEDPGFIEYTPHLGSDILDHILPLISARVGLITLDSL
jgi:hypothetical protein